MKQLTGEKQYKATAEMIEHLEAALKTMNELGIEKISNHHGQMIFKALYGDHETFGLKDFLGIMETNLVR